MKYQDFIHMSVPGDGACFFHSLAHILIMEGNLNQNRNALAKKLRKQCVDWLENNLDFTISQIGMTIREEIEEAVRHCVTTKCGHYKNVNKYLEYMRKNKAYAGQIEIYAMSYYLGRSIRVFIKNKDKFKSSGLGFMIGLKHDPMDDIHIYHNIGENVSANEHHFEPLYPKVKAKKEKDKDKDKDKDKTKDKVKITKEKKNKKSPTIPKTRTKRTNARPKTNVRPKTRLRTSKRTSKRRIKY